MNAEQKLRESVVISPHEGPDAIHWLTGGGPSLPPAWVTFTQEGEQIIVKCAKCKTILGYLPADRDPAQMHNLLVDIRLQGHETHKPEGWPR